MKKRNKREKVLERVRWSNKTGEGKKIKRKQIRKTWKEKERNETMKETVWFPSEINK